ncbi:hypothetical protein TNCV_4384651 [Trichonephila clavipes]|nr:hypothetical protein TNCV_4384651 [Trichonephila clavipes]
MGSVCRKSPDNKMSAPPKIRLFPLKSRSVRSSASNALVRHCTFVPYDNLTRLEYFSHSRVFADVACWCLSVLQIQRQFQC